MARHTVLFVHQGSELYGSDRVLLNIAKGLVGSEVYEPLVLLPGSGPLADELQKFGVKVLYGQVGKISRRALHPARLPRLMIDLFRGMNTVRSIVRRHDVRVVHSNTIAVMAGALGAWITRTPHVWHVHELIVSPPAMRRAFPWLVDRFSDRVLCISRMNLKWLQDEQPSIASKLRLVWNGVERSAPGSRDDAHLVRAAFGTTGSKEVVVAFVGRFNRWKGQGLLLDAVSGLWREGFRDLRLLLVGGPPPGEDHLLSELQAAVGASDARDAVRILSFRPDVWPIWEACDIAVVPSLEPEPFGLVAIEAMLMGKPVVAAAHGGLLDIVESGQTGLLFEPGNVTSLKDALRRLIVDPALREKLGVAGRDRRLKLFSVESQVETVSKVYAELLGAP